MTNLTLLEKENISFIRQTFTPIQPSFKTAGENISYKEYFPSPALCNYIYCFWELKTLQRLEKTFIYRVVADGCIDIFFDLNQLKESYVMGFSNSYSEFEVGNSFHYAGIRFLPVILPQIFKLDASEFSNKAIKLLEIIPQVDQFVKNRINSEMSFDTIRNNFDIFFTEIINSMTLTSDKRLYSAIHEILSKKGEINLQKELDCGLSPRQLRRLFEIYIGDTPKTFSKVVRFQHVLKTHFTHNNNAPIAIDGYYDQSHFIKDFKSLYGSTPAKALDLCC